MNTRPARTRAVAAQDQAIQNNVAKIEAQREAQPVVRPSALAILAQRLNVSETGLQETLLATVFKGASKADFTALIIVANEYQLNPLVKEMYAFPAKGGGIVPMISVDGWITLMNRHAMFDGIEFNDIADDEGKLMAIEAIIYRKDRSRPIRVTEYLDECRRGTDPWKQSPARMLRHRALIQCVRIAFGISGALAEEDGDIEQMRPLRVVEPMPARGNAPALPPAAAEQIDGETGEVMSEEDIARQLDAQTMASSGVLSAAEASADADEAASPFDLADFEARLRAAATVIDLNKLEAEFTDGAETLPDADYQRLQPIVEAARQRILGKR